MAKKVFSKVATSKEMDKVARDIQKRLKGYIKKVKV